MQNITSLSLSQLRSSTKPQILAAWSAGLTALSKRQLIMLDLVLRNTDIPDQIRLADNTIRTFAADGQVLTEIDVDRDAETNAMIGGTSRTYTYYPSGEIDTIVISARDASNTEIRRKTIRHYLNGDQPTVSEQ